MTGPLDSWDALDDLLSRDESERKDQDKFRNEPRRPATGTARKTAPADDWLGLRPQSTAETGSYEPSSSSRGGPTVSRRQNLRRQSTQQQRPSRSAGLLFDDDNDDDADRGVGRSSVFNDLFADTTAGRPMAVDAVDRSSMTVAINDSVLTKRRETSPSITVAATTKITPAASAPEKMPPWLSGLVQHKDPEIVTSLTPSPLPPQLVVSKVKEQTEDVQKPEENRNKIVEENTLSVLSLLKNKESLQSSILELIRELAKKKQDIQQAAITLIHDQQNSDLLIKALIMDNNSSTIMDTSGGQELENLRSENNKLLLTIDHLSKKHELELDALKTKYELQQNMLHEKLDRYEERINELEEERRAETIERKENEKRLKEMYEDRLRLIHESHLIDLKQSADVQKIKMNHLEEVESCLRDSKPKRLSGEEITAREISFSAQDKKLKDLQEEINKQMAVLEEERSALRMKVDEFQSRNEQERNELELASKELKRSMKAFENGRKTWEREKKSEIQYIESRKQELEDVRSSVVEEQRKLAEERFEVASERYKLESMLKLDSGTGTDLIQAKVEVNENFKELKKRERELEKRLEHVKEMEKRLAEEKQKLQEQDDEIKLKTIRAEKLFKNTIAKQEEGLKALESARDIQSKFDKKGKDIQNRLMDVMRREENVTQEETKLTMEKETLNKQRKKLDLVLPQLSADEMRFLNPGLNKYEPEKEVYYKKTKLY